MTHRLLVLAAATTLAGGAALAHGGHGCGPALQAELPALFAQADINGDGSLTLDEFKTYKQLVAARCTEIMFQRLDANGDGKVTLDEITAHAAQRAEQRARKHSH